MKGFHLTAKWRRVLLKALILSGGALLLTFFLEYRYFVNDFGRAWQFVTESPLVYLYSSFLVLLVLMIIFGLTNRPFLTVSIGTSIIIIVGYIHINKFVLRGTPLLPEDFQLASEAASLTKFIDWWSLIRMIMAVILCIALGILLDWLMRRKLQRSKDAIPKNWLVKYDIVPRVILIVVAVVGFTLGTDFARNHHGQRYEAVPWLDTEFVAWNQTRNYDTNGFVLGFLYNWGKFELIPPDGYGKTAVDEIAATYQAKQAADTARISLADTDYNIVIILNESFYDPELIKDYYPYEGGDVTPNLHKIMDQNPSGRMYSLDYGGGTANIEFEAFTGLSNYWANTVPYTDLLPKTGAIPSVASWVKKYDYDAVAVHPFNGGMYKRNIALTNEGFDQFITELEIQHTEHDENSQYINDQAAYAETLDVLTNHEQKTLVGLITMQNHAPYDADIYAVHDFNVTDGYGGDLGRKSDIETYLQTLHSSDRYLGDFIQKLDDFNEKTIVLFYGDHSPGIFPEVIESENSGISNLARMTPYFIYANFEVNPEILAVHNLKNWAEGAHRLKTTTPNCLVNTMYNLFEMTKPVLGYLLDDICTETPILTQAYFGGDGPFQSTALSSYEMVTYDLLDGKKYWMKATND